MDYLLLTLIILLLVVLLPVTQAVYLKKTAIRLPEAKGYRRSLNNAPVSLLHIGESPVAGVGIKYIEQGLTVKTAGLLSEKLACPIDWQIIAKNGAKVSDLSSSPAMISEPDILILSFGVNDTTKFTSREKWINSLTNAISHYAGNKTQVFVTSVPQIQYFPLLPFPLSWLLGFKARSLDKCLKQLCEKSGWHYVFSDIKPDISTMATDGYHPNTKGYLVWATLLSDVILEKYRM